MIRPADPITVSVPRDILADIVEVSAGLADRMHELLERNTDGALTPTETSELESIVRIAELGQIATLALQSSGER